MTSTDTLPTPPAAAPKQSKAGRHKFINKASVRKLALDICATDIRHKKFNRVGESFWDAIDAATRMAIHARVKAQPSVGKTLT